MQVFVLPAKAATAQEKVLWFFSSEKSILLQRQPRPNREYVKRGRNQGGGDEDG